MRSNLSIWRPDRTSGRSGYDNEGEWVRTLRRDGAVIVIDDNHRPWNHHVIGVGVGHDDADFAETGRSYAAYLENDRQDGPWWDNLDGFFGTRRDYDPEAIRASRLEQAS